MRAELQEKLYKKYPKIFKQKDLPMTETCMCWGISCGRGWYNLIDCLCDCIQNHIDSEISNTKHRQEYLTLWLCIKQLFSLGSMRNYLRWPRVLRYNLRQFQEWWMLRGTITPERYQVEASQVKEKFGGLRFYVDHSNDTVDGMIAVAEAMSYQICEECGQPGKSNNKGWIRTLCDACRNMKEERKDENME